MTRIEWHYLGRMTMNKINNKIFIATPISGFSEITEYLNFRTFTMQLVAVLREKGYFVCTEVERIADPSDYSSPQKSIKEDFDNILSSDVFVFLHPKLMQTSSLIELGFACASNKKIVIVGNDDVLPYLVKDLPKSDIHAIKIDLIDHSREQVARICDAIDNIVNS